MKKKINLLIIISLLFCITDANAQTRFYDTDRTFNEQGFTYVSRTIAGIMVHLHNSNHRWIGITQKNRDGTGGHEIELPSQFQTNNAIQMKQQARTIINNAFTPAERERIRGERLTIIMYVDSQTGRVDDVVFRFVRIGGFATIPVTTYRRIETELKNRIQFIPTDAGRRRNFLMTSIVFEP